MYSTIVASTPRQMGGVDNSVSRVNFDIFTYAFIYISPRSLNKY